MIGLINTFSNEQKCIEYLEQIRWNGKVVSPFDPTSKVYKCSKGYWCKNTNKVFNVKTGTLFENTKIPLQKWFISIWLITSHKKGISSLQLSKDINVTQKTSWFMLQRIRKCFEEENNSTLYNEVEIDEDVFEETGEIVLKLKSDFDGGSLSYDHPNLLRVDFVVTGTCSNCKNRLN